MKHRAETTLELNKHNANMKEASNANDREDIVGMRCLGTKGDTQHHEGIC